MNPIELVCRFRKSAITENMHKYDKKQRRFSRLLFTYTEQFDSTVHKRLLTDIQPDGKRTSVVLRAIPNATRLGEFQTGLWIERTRLNLTCDEWLWKNQFTSILEVSRVPESKAFRFFWFSLRTLKTAIWTSSVYLKPFSKCYQTNIHSSRLIVVYFTIKYSMHWRSNFWTVYFTDMGITKTEIRA